MEKYRCEVFSVFEDKKKLPDGTIQKHFGYISHRGGVFIMPFLGKDVFLIKQYRPAVGKWLYEFPAGTINKGENPLNCAKREIEEELGYKADKMRFLFKYYVSPGIMNQVYYMFIATNLRKTKQSLDQHEFIKIERMSVDKAMRLLKMKKITNGATITGLLYYDKYLKGYKN